MDARVPTLVHVDRNVMDAATAQAKRQGISRAELIRRALAAWVERAA